MIDNLCDVAAGIDRGPVTPELTIDRDRPGCDVAGRVTLSSVTSGRDGPAVVSPGIVTCDATWP